MNGSYGSLTQQLAPQIFAESWRRQAEQRQRQQSVEDYYRNLALQREQEERDFQRRVQALQLTAELEEPYRETTEQRYGREAEAVAREARYRETPAERSAREMEAERQRIVGVTELERMKAGYEKEQREAAHEVAREKITAASAEREAARLEAESKELAEWMGKFGEDWNAIVGLHGPDNAAQVAGKIIKRFGGDPRKPIEEQRREVRAAIGDSLETVATKQEQEETRKRAEGKTKEARKLEKQETKAKRIATLPERKADYEKQVRANMASSQEGRRLASIEKDLADAEKALEKEEGLEKPRQARKDELNRKIDNLKTQRFVVSHKIEQDVAELMRVWEESQEKAEQTQVEDFSAQVRDFLGSALG